MNRVRARAAADKRRQILGDMRRVIQGALSARDQPPDFNGMPEVGSGSTHSSLLEPTTTPVDRTGAADRMGMDSTISARSRMLANMKRLSGNTGVAFSPSNVGGSSPGVGGGPSADFLRRNPWASRVKLG